MSIYSKLLDIQNELKAPKSQFNKFGNYNYRNCEDILESVKPICKKHNAVVYLSDKLVLIGERYYIEATATLVDVETSETAVVTAYAREEENKKGMDGSQITGASSSYARKYALNGLFDIDDTKDSDTTNQDNAKPKEQSYKQPLGEEQRNYEREIDKYATLLSEHSKKTPDEWKKLAAEKNKDEAAQANCLISKWNKKLKQIEEQNG